MTITLWFVVTIVFHSFNAYAFSFDGYSRILSVLYPLLFIIAGIYLNNIKDFDLKITSNKILKIKSCKFKLFVLTIILIEMIESHAVWIKI